ncbi:MAG: class I SAM-dependent methyltransferase [Bacillota bacterium]|nr:class I SAM-dependent methyltransferase [Bacillota bacterium]
MSNVQEFWRNMWNEHAESDSMFVQMGCSSYTPFEYFLTQKDIVDALQFQRDDMVLDAGSGVGWTSMYLSPFVKEIMIFDYAENMIEKAKRKIEHFGNISAVRDDILLMNNIKGRYFNKVIVNSVLQYLENYKQVQTALSNIFSVMSQSSMALFSRNPDMGRKKDHIESYSRLNWDNERIARSLEFEEKRLWLDFNLVKDLALETGFKKCYKVDINPTLWQSTHMFDFVVVK